MTEPPAVQDTISRFVDITTVDAGGADFVIETNEGERAAIAKRLDIPGLQSLRGSFRLTPVRGGVEVRLALDAVAERICVASLEPMTETIREEFTLVFDRNFEADDLDEFAESETLREPLEGDEIDLGEILVQHLSLSLDPFPRKSGAESLADKFRDATSASPFSALKGLVDRDS